MTAIMTHLNIFLQVLKHYFQLFQLSEFSKITHGLSSTFKTKFSSTLKNLMVVLNICQEIAFIQVWDWTM